MGRVEQGLDELRAVAVATPGSYETWLIMGRECMYLGRWEEAAENLDRALRNATTQESRQDVYLAFFELYRAQGRIEDAIAAWDQAWKEKAEPDDVSPVYQMLIEHERFEQAHQYLERETNALRREFYQGLLEARKGRIQEAQRHWQKVAKMNPFKFEDGFEEWAEAALRTNLNPEEIIKVLDRTQNVLHLTPRRAVLSAIAEARLGNVDNTERALRQGCLLEKLERPRREKLSAKDWALFDELVTDAEVKQKLKSFFEEGATE
jgi:tetratricopeptide (TPR) repeat protein